MNKKVILNVLTILVIVSMVILTNLSEKIVVEEEFRGHTFRSEYTIKEAAGIKFIQRGSVFVTVDSQKNLMPFCYHQIWLDEELNRPLGKLGSMTFILDSDGRFISKGYHELFLKNGQIYGQVGATTESVKIW